jgi:hypothetical protein
MITTTRARIGILGIGIGLLTGALTAPATAAAPDKPVGGPLPSAISADVPAGFSSVNELMTVQRRLNAVANRLTASLAARPGFAGVTVPVEQRQVRLYWKGTVPAAVRERVAAVRGDAAVVVQPARFSKAQLQAARTSLLRRAGQAGVTVQSVGVRADGSGLTVSASGAKAEEVLDSESAVVARRASRPVTGSRINDSPPYWGGARWTVPGSSCTTGFPIIRNSDAREFMLSAGHCAANNNTALDGGGQTMGTVSGDNNPRDWLLIGANTAGRIYIGVVDQSGNPVSETSLRVAGWAANHVGNLVCTNGSYSGSRCNVRITATDQTIFFGDVGYSVTDLVEAEHVTRTNAGGDGDSGSGVFSLADTTSVYAHGIFTGMDLGTAVPCTGVPASSSRTCTSRIYFSEIGDALVNYGARIQVD